MYSQQKVHVPQKYHGKIKAAMTQNHPLAVKLDLKKNGETTMVIQQF